MRIAANNRTCAFTLVEIMIVIAIIGLLAAIALPNMIKARVKSQKVACIKNLQMIDGAKETWALDTRRGLSDPVSDTEVNGYIKGGAPRCPASGTYVYNDLVTAPACTIEGHVISAESLFVAGDGVDGGTGGTSAGGSTGDTSTGGTSSSGSSGNSGPGGDSDDGG